MSGYAEIFRPLNDPAPWMSADKVRGLIDGLLEEMTKDQLVAVYEWILGHTQP